MQDVRPHPLGLLAGILFVALVIVAFVVLGGDTPELKDSAQKVQSYYTDHNDREQAASVVLAIAMLFGAIFVGHLWSYLRGATGPGAAWPAVALVGGTVAIAGFLTSAGIHLALAEAADKHYTADSLRTLNALDSDTFFAMGGGMAILLLGSGASLLRSAAAPAWLAWSALVIGILGFTPIGFFAFAASALWVLAASVVLSGRVRAAATPSAPGTASPVA